MNHGLNMSLSFLAMTSRMILNFKKKLKICENLLYSLSKDWMIFPMKLGKLFIKNDSSNRNILYSPKPKSMMIETPYSLD